MLHVTIVIWVIKAISNDHSKTQFSLSSNEVLIILKLNNV